MTREDKKQLIDALTAEFQAANGIVVCDYKGLTVKELEKLRALARDNNMKVKVIKNTLARISLDNCGKSGLSLKDTNIFIWGEDLVTVAKIAAKYDAESSDKFSIKSGHFEGKAVDASKVVAYSKLASKEEFLGMLLSVWTAPVRNLLYVWTGKQRELVTALDAIKKQKEAA